MKLDKSNISCGIYQLSGLGAGPENLVKYVKETLLAKTVRKEHDWNLANARPPVIIFSARTEGSFSCSGDKLRNYIRKHKLGTVRQWGFENHCLEKADCALYMWKLDYKAMGIESLLQSYK